jgi:hypothetical protein
LEHYKSFLSYMNILIKWWLAYSILDI